MGKKKNFFSLFLPPPPPKISFSLSLGHVINFQSSLNIETQHTSAVSGAYYTSSISIIELPASDTVWRVCFYSESMKEAETPNKHPA